MEKKTWIGLAHVTPLPGNDRFEDAIGAFVPVVGLGTDADEFTAAVATLMATNDFEVTSIEDVEELDAILAAGDENELEDELEEDILMLAADLSPETPIAMGGFEPYDSDE